VNKPNGMASGEADERMEKIIGKSHEKFGDGPTPKSPTAATDANTCPLATPKSNFNALFLFSK
jgi:hypothetical protein